MAFAIRPFHPSDMPALYRICLLTGDSGGDASSMYRDGELLGHFYAAPYAVLEPDLCFILTRDGTPCGYVLGTRDSAAFEDATGARWLPVLRQRYPLPAADDTTPDAAVIRRIHDGRTDPKLIDYPAHLHIDLLPEAQGHGNGRALMETFLNRLREIGVPGVHLGVSATNTRAVGFYERMGFHVIAAFPWGQHMGMHL